MTDLSFLSAPGMAAGFTAETRPRAHGAGVDLYEYDRVTAPLESMLQWPDVCRAAALRHRAAAEQAAELGRTRTAGERHRLAARWFHLAALMPDPDRERAAEVAREADRSMGQSLALLEPQSRRLFGDGFTGWLRTPAGANGKRFPVAVVIPGMDSSKEEFHALADALLPRGVAVLAIDGPGQGVLAAETALDVEGHRRAVVRALDALAGVGTAGVGTAVVGTADVGTVGVGTVGVGMADVSTVGIGTADVGTAGVGTAGEAPIDLGRIAVVGLSLGGYLAAAVAAHDRRVRAAALVSGPYRLEWDALVPFVIATLGQRCGSADAARAFVDGLDLAALAPHLRCPLLLVEGGQDRIPGVTNAEALTADLPHAELLHVPHGNHLLGKAQSDWLPDAADWLAETLLSA